MSDSAEKFDFEKHAEVVKGWLSKHSFPLPPQELLSDVGFIVNDAACGFLYVTNSKLGWIEWVCSNPEKSKEERTKALDTLFKLLEATAAELGMHILFSASGFSQYSEILDRNGFQKTDQNMSHYIKEIGDVPWQ